MSYTIDQLTTIADFAKEYEVSVGTVTNWMDKSGDDKPETVHTIGRTRLFLKDELVRLAEMNASGAVMQKVGYVHPDKYAELERHYFESINQRTELERQAQAISDAYNEQVKLNEEQAEQISQLKAELQRSQTYVDSIIEG